MTTYEVTHTDPVTGEKTTFTREYTPSKNGGGGSVIDIDSSGEVITAVQVDPYFKNYNYVNPLTDTEKQKIDAYNQAVNNLNNPSPNMSVNVSPVAGSKEGLYTPLDTSNFGEVYVKDRTGAFSSTGLQSSDVVKQNILSGRESVSGNVQSTYKPIKSNSDTMTSAFGSNPFTFVGNKASEIAFEPKYNELRYATTSVALYGGTVVTPFAIPFAVQRGYQDFGLIKGGSEYQDYYFNKGGQETGLFMESQNYNYQKNSNSLGKFDFRDVTRFGFGGLVSGGFADKVTEDTFNRFKSQGYSEDTAYKYTEFALRERTYSELGSFIGLVSINAISNRMASKLYEYNALKLADKGLSNVAFKWGVIKRSLPLAGVYEGASGVALYENSAYNKVNKRDVFWGGVTGGISSVGIQAGIELPSAFIADKASRVSSPFVKNTFKYFGGGLGKGSQVNAYFVDPIGEPLGDLADVASMSPKFPYKVNVMTQSFGFTKNGNTFSYSSDVLGQSGSPRDFSFTFNNPLTKVNSQNNAVTKNYPVVKNNAFSLSSNARTFDFTPSFPRSNNFLPVNSNPFTEVNTKSYPVTNTNPYSLVNSNPFTDVNPNPFTNTNPFTNVNPNPNPFTNTFVGKIPFVPPLRGFGDFNFNFPRRSGRKTVYTPSLTALGFNIRSKRTTNTLTGIGIRPIVY